MGEAGGPERKDYETYICNGGGVPGFQGYFVAPVRIVVAPVYNGDGGACCRVIKGVVCFVDNCAVIFYFGDLAVIAYDTVVSARDACRAGVDVVGVAGEGGRRDYFINRKIAVCR